MWNGKWSEVEKQNIAIWSGSIRVFVLHEKSFHKPCAKHILEVTADEVQKSTHIHSARRSWMTMWIMGPKHVDDEFKLTALYLKQQKCLRKENRTDAEPFFRCEKYLRLDKMEC